MPASAASRRDSALRPAPAVTTRYPARTSAPPTALPISPVPTTATVPLLRRHCRKTRHVRSVQSAPIIAVSGALHAPFAPRNLERRHRSCRQQPIPAVAGPCRRPAVHLRPVHARHRLGLSRAERRRALDAPRTRAARARRRHAGSARRGDLGDRHRRALARRRAPRQHLRDAGLGALRARRGPGLMPARDYWYRFTSGGQREPDRPHAHGRGARVRRRTASRSRSRRASTTSKVTTPLIARSPPTRSISSSTSATTSTKTAARPACARTISPSAIRSTTIACATRSTSLDPHLKAAHAAAPWMLVVRRSRGRQRLRRRALGSRRSARAVPRAARGRLSSVLRAPAVAAPARAGRGRSSARTRSRSFGDLVTVFMLDGRQYRSPQACEPGPLVEPCAELYAGERTMLGDVQEQWLATRARGEHGALEPARPADAVRAFRSERRRSARLLGRRLERLSGRARAARRGAAQRQHDREPRRLERRHPRVPRQRRPRGGPRISSRRSSRPSSSRARSARIGPPQATFDRWRAENPNVRLARSD